MLENIIPLLIILSIISITISVIINLKKINPNFSFSNLKIVKIIRVKIQPLLNIIKSILTSKVFKIIYILGCLIVAIVSVKAIIIGFQETFLLKEYVPKEEVIEPQESTEEQTKEENTSTNEEIPQTIIQEQKDNITSNNNSNSNNNPSNTTTQKVCNESAKQQLTNEYQTTLQQRENEYQANLSKAQQEVAFAKESLDLTGGYLSSEEYDTLYNQTKSDTYRELLKNRYNMSITYDKMVNTLNAIPTTYENWKNTYNAWYKEELNKLGC